MESSAEGERVIADRYRLGDVLGTGSMGKVWSAFDGLLQRPAAVKAVQLPRGVPQAEVQQMRERTLREARAIAALSHPNVITLYDVVISDGEPFVLMELLAARSLAALLTETGPIEVGKAAAIGQSVAAALAAAHDAGITHRDVKPGNVLVAEDGRVKLTDFGIARNAAEATMTSTGLTLGSPAYMAPEIAAGKKVTAAADLWGLGATLFAATAGHPPYDADGDPLTTVNQVVNEAVPAPPPGPLAGVITDLMSKDPAQRPTAAQIAERLAPFAEPTGPLFPTVLFDQATAGRDRRPEPASAGAPAPAKPTSTAALADEPGPLPFLPAPRAAPRTKRTAVMLTVLALVVFVAATAGGFAVARALGGEAVLPPDHAATDPAADPATEPLVERTAEATFLQGDKAATFTVGVPADWTKFVSQHVWGGLPNSALVQFVSPDGRQLLTVERFPAFFTEHSVDDYLEALDARTRIDIVERELDDGSMALTYRTVEREGTASIRRSTFAGLQQAGQSLWVVEVTVPTSQEATARTALYDRIMETFTID